MGEKIFNGVKKLGTKIKSIGLAIKNLAKFFATALGQVCLWIVIILLVVILLYILARTVSVAIRKVLGVEDAGIKDTNDYAILQQLTSSGYNELMPSDELAQYMNYEYAVMMDAARFFSETGVVEREHVDTVNNFDLSQLTEEETKELLKIAYKGTDTDEYKSLMKQIEERMKADEEGRLLEKRKTDALKAKDEFKGQEQLLLEKHAAVGGKDEDAASALQKHVDEIGKEHKVKKVKVKDESGKTVSAYLYEDVLKAVREDIQLVDKEIAAADVAYARYEEVKKKEGSTKEEIEEAMKELEKAMNVLKRKYGPEELTNAHSNIEMFYKVVENDAFDGQESLAPYLRIFRQATTYTYRYIVDPGTDIGKWFSTQSNKDLRAATEEFYNPLATKKATDYSGLYSAMSPYYINLDLNCRNKDLWKHSQARGGTGEPLTTTRLYPHDTPFVEIGDNGSATYEIPFKVIVNRFLPKAQLLSSWYMLKDSNDDGTVANLLDEIQSIYDYYCLRGESVDGTAKDLMVRYANSIGVRLREKGTHDLYNDPLDATETRDIEGNSVLNQEMLTNLYSFIVYERIELAFFTGGKLEFFKESFRAITDLVEAAQMKIDFDVHYSYTYTLVKINPDGTRQDFPGRSVDKTLTGEDATKLFESEINKILNAEVPIVIDGKEVYIHSLKGMGIRPNQYDPYAAASESDSAEGTDDASSSKPSEPTTPTKDPGFTAIKYTGLRSKNQPIDKDGNTNYTFEEELDGKFYHITSSQTNTEDNYTKYNISDLGVDKIRVAIKNKLEELIEENFKDWRPDDIPGSDKIPSTPEELAQAAEHPERSYITNVSFKKWERDYGGDDVPEKIIVDNLFPIFTVEDIEFQIRQVINTKTMPNYFPIEAHTWSRDIMYSNEAMQGADFDVNNTTAAMLMSTGLYTFGTTDFQATHESIWRVEMYSPLFTDVREKDFIAMLAEWETVADDGEFAADTYIRDLYSLIQYSKPEYNNVTKAGSTVDENNYIYINIPDEILYFDEDVSDYAFWLEHLQATNADPIEPEENITMRSRIPIMKWQQVDYSLYDECYDEKTNKYRVYAMWPEGGYVSKSLYAISANATNASNDVIESWGGWKWNGRHAGLDLYGRRTTNLLVSAYASRIKTSGSKDNVSIYTTKGTDSTVIDGMSGSSSDTGVETKSVSTTKMQELVEEVRKINLYSTYDESVQLQIDQIREQGEDLMESSKYASSEEYDAMTKEYYRLLAQIQEVEDMSRNSDMTDLGKIEAAGDGKLDDAPRGSKRITGIPKYGVYSTGPTSIMMDSTVYSFESSGAALYAYELYRLTRATDDAEGSSNTLVLKLLDETKNMPLVSIAPGIVKEVVARPSSGFKVVVEHTRDGSVTSNYIHMKRYPQVQKGEYVGAGTLLGYEGTTGGSAGVHLHFEIKTKEFGGGTYAVPYLYPFFNPFYKAPEEGQKAYDLSSEYWSLIRTVYPVNQIVSSDLLSRRTSSGYLEPKEPRFITVRRQQVDAIKQVKVDKNGMIVMQNYVPTLPLLDDYNELCIASDETISDDFLEKPKDLNVTDGIAYGGGPVRTYGIYFDHTFLQLVKEFSGYLFTGIISNPTPHIFDNNKPKFGDHGFNYSVSVWKQYELALTEEVVKAGFGSRAGVVAAARFLAGMDHAVPYLGQMTTKTDVGIYARRGLNSTWGQKVYCNGHIVSHNGFDCTGYVNWCLINGGVAPEGYNGGGYVLGGETIRTTTAINTGRLKVGDILESRSYTISGTNGELGWQFTHIGILIGIKGDHYYVAEERAGRLRISDYTKEDFKNKLNFAMVDKDAKNPLYPAEGNMNKVTNQTWYNRNGSAVANF